MTAVDRTDKPYWFPAIAIVSSLAFTVALAPDPLWLRGLLLFTGCALGFFGVWATHRRGATVKNLQSDLVDEKTKVENLLGEAVVAKQFLAETRTAVEELIGTKVKRQVLDHDLGPDDRITWVLVGGDHLRVVGRHCNTAVLCTINQRRYDLDHGLMGRALELRRNHSAAFDATGTDTYEQWQVRVGRLDNQSAARALSMDSKEYRVVPLANPDGLSMLGLIVLESREAGTTRLDKVVDQLDDPLYRRTVVDVLSVLAQAPDMYPDAPTTPANGQGGTT